LTRAGYERAFAGKGITWGEAETLARHYVPFIENWRADLLEEIQGIASGSGLTFDEVLTINCRTEILWSVATLATDRLAEQFWGECSSFALEPSATANGATLVGQNWDWLDTLSGGVIVLEVERPDGPNYVTIVEAGLLAKTSLNQRGIGLALNTLVSSLDGGKVGIPFHFLIRDLVDSEHLSDAVTKLSAVLRASSGNYVLGSSDGGVLNIEVAPGDARNVFPIVARNGAIVHTNHFLSQIHTGFDLAPGHMGDSYIRYSRMARKIQDETTPLSIDDIKQVLGDHTDAPSAICCHPDSRSDVDTQWATLAAVIMDPANRRVHLAEGTPCSEDWITLDYSKLLT
jgi:isopenicillin-N N-acyltransferase-like protein